jgi:hypothetical protein
MHNQSTDAADHERRGQAVAKSSFYHLCVRCDAKWFTEAALCRCPRCGKRCRSEVQLQPPWVHPAKPPGE